MTIWIVWYTNFASKNEFSQAFSTEAKAQEYILRFSNFDQSSFYIEEYTLDD